jgi:alkanesulfonate monooxygenase
VSDHGLTLFATCPPSKGHVADAYVRWVRDVARWSDEAGYEGILVYTDNGLVDPWLLAQVILQSTERLAPLVAVQSVYMHPYAAAKMVATLGYLHGRRVWINLVAGGFRNDLLALDDDTPHDQRYDRTVEYGQIMRRLLSGETVTATGHYYRVKNLRLTPALPEALRPGFLMSGSSPAGLAAARRLGATAVKYPKRPEEETPNEGAQAGVRLGIITRPDADSAWNVAEDRFPADRKGQLTHALAMKVSDSSWHQQLSRLGAPSDRNSPYWLRPFENYKTFCPYLVGSYDRVAGELQRYMARGFRTFILDVPHSPEDLAHIAEAFRVARAAK